MALLHDSLQRFTLRQSDDIVKTDLELICDECGERLCDAEDGDTLATLASVADEHVCSDEEHEEE